ncbi:MAG: hypothetical protein KC609_16535 [Myxococcales bacterium]|nr:hypothetical protein [Myxococcales bacterium]
MSDSTTLFEHAIPYLDELRIAIPSDTRRICLAGFGTADVAIEYARGGSFVTVVNPDHSECEALRSALSDLGLRERITVWNKHFMEHTFESSGLDALAVYDGIRGPSEAKSFFKKCRREVRAGGLFFTLQRVDPRLIEHIPSKLANIWEGASHILDQFDWFHRNWPTLNGLNGHELLEMAEEYVTIERKGLHHLALPYLRVAAVAVAGRPSRGLARLFRRLAALEDRFLYEEELKLFARAVLIAGRMETQMGRVFNIRSTRSV